MEHNIIQFETSGDGENSSTYRKINIAETSMISNNGSGENASCKVTYKPQSNKDTTKLHWTIIKKNDQENSKLMSSSTKSAHIFNEFQTQICDLNMKSSSDHQLISNDTSKNNNYSIQAIKLFEESDITLQSLSLSKNGYYNSQESLSLSITSSFSSQSQEDQETIKAGRIDAFNSWLKKKEDEKKAKIEKTKTLVKSDKTEISPEQKEVLFRKWLEKKQSIKETNKAKLLLKADQEKERKKQKEFEKEEKLKQWNEKKVEILKDIKVSEIKHATAIQRAKQQKRIENDKAYQRWLQESKSKPLPVPLNKGKLSMRSTLSAMYINPEPWKFSYDQQDDTA